MRNEISHETVPARAVSRRRSWQGYACRDRMLLPCLLVFSLALGGIGVCLRPPPFDDFNMMLSVMVATGRGFVEPVEGNGALIEYPQAPELVRFLKHETPRLSPEQVPPNLETRPPKDDWPYHHKYLFYTVGVLWRVFGISWDVVQALRVFFYCAMLLATYGLFRLGIGPLGSALATFFMGTVIGYGFLLDMASLRDYSKGAFLLPVMLIVGCLVKRPVKTRTFLALAALLGLVIGFGYGFRGDVLIGLPAAFFVLAFSRRPRPGWNLVERFAAMGLLLALYVPLALPLVAGGNTGQFAHDVSLGFATKNDDLLKVGRASYERLPMNNDILLDALTDRRARTAEPKAQWNQPARRNHLLFKTVFTFPADMLTRAYAAVLHVVGGKIMAICAALALLLIARVDLYLAAMTFLLFLYFCGYLSIQAEYRHAFHLAFVPVWIIAFLMSAAARAWKDRRRLGLLAWRSPENRRMLQFAVGAVLLLAVPLYAARAWQDIMVGRLLNEYESVDAEPVPVEPAPLIERTPHEDRPGIPKDWVLFQCPTVMPPHSGISRDQAYGPCRVEYWMAEFAPSVQWRPVWLQYHRSEEVTKFATGLWLSPCAADDTGTLRYFFPVVVYADPSPGNWTYFAGLALPKESMADFKGLYRVRNEARFTFFLNLCLPADRASFVRHQTLYGWTPNGDYAEDSWDARLWMKANPLTLLPRVGITPKTGDPEKSVEKYREAVTAAPQNILLRVGLALALETRGERDAALQAYRDALAANPRCYVSYHYVDAFLKRGDDPGTRTEFWRETQRLYPDVYLPRFHLARALEEQGVLDEAVEAYRASLQACPEDSCTWKDLGRLLLEKDPAAAKDAYQRALAVNPLDVEAATCLAGLP